MQLIFEKAKRGYVGKIAFKCVNFGFACHILLHSASGWAVGCLVNVAPIYKIFALILQILTPVDIILIYTSDIKQHLL